MYELVFRAHNSQSNLLDNFPKRANSELSDEKYVSESEGVHLLMKCKLRVRAYVCVGVDVDEDFAVPSVGQQLI